MQTKRLKKNNEVSKNTRDYFDQKIYKLINLVDFQDDIKILRKKWKIKKGGFKKQKDSENWHKKLMGDTQIYLRSQNFKDQELIESKFKEVKFANNRANQQEKYFTLADFELFRLKMRRKNPFVDYKEDKKDLISKYNLNENWEGFIDQYLLTNDITAVRDNRVTFFLDYKKNKLYIGISEITHFEDIEANRNEIKRAQKEFYGNKFKANIKPSDFKIVERNIYIHNLSKSKKPQEIAIHLYEKYRDLPDNDPTKILYSLDYKQIREIIDTVNTEFFKKTD